MQKRTGKLGTGKTLKLVTICRWLAVRSMSRDEPSRWPPPGCSLGYTTRKDLVEVVIKVEDKENVPTAEYVWCVEENYLILRYNKEDLRKKRRRYLAR